MSQELQFKVNAMNIQIPFRFITGLILLNLHFSAHTQVSFLEPDTAVWRFRGIVHDSPCFHYDWQYMLSSQESIVGAHTYRKMYQLGHQLVYLDCIEPPLGSTLPQPTIPWFAGLIREEGRKVYFWPWSFDSEYLAYDFDQQVGDTIPAYHAQYVTITSIEEIVLNGKIFKQYILGRIEDPIDTIIEGIGTNSFPFYNSTDQAQRVNLVCYSRNDTVYYHRYDSCGFFELPPIISAVDKGADSKRTGHDFVQLVYPNPATNQVNLVFNEPGAYSVEVFDQLGVIHQVESVLSDTGILLDLNLVQNGVYLLYIQRDSILVSVKRLVVLR